MPVRWWSPGEGTRLPAYVTYPNAWGEVGILNTAGAVDTKGHPFFEPIGQNGRACVSCHQPGNGMSISVAAMPQTPSEMLSAAPHALQQGFSGEHASIVHIPSIPATGLPAIFTADPDAAHVASEMGLRPFDLHAGSGAHAGSCA